MKLSPNFYLHEFTKTNYQCFQDEPSTAAVLNLCRLCALVLQPLRDALAAPVIVTSGYRSEQLNAFVGGVKNSRHMLGAAADLRVFSDTNARKMFDILAALPDVDAVLFEHSKSGQWLHVQIAVGDAQPRRYSNYNYKA